MNIPYLHKEQTKLLLQVIKDLGRHEGFREYAYPDPLSYIARTYKSKDWGYKPARKILEGKKVNFDDGKPWTYGYGFTHGVTEDSKIGRITADRKLEQEILEIDCALRNTLSWYEEASLVTKTILINMAFNMGPKRLLKFKNTLNYISQKNYTQASINMLKSLWAKQVSTRAKELAERMRTQQIPQEYKAPESIK